MKIPNPPPPYPVPHSFVSAPMAHVANCPDCSSCPHPTLTPPCPFPPPLPQSRNKKLAMAGCVIRNQCCHFSTIVGYSGLVLTLPLTQVDRGRQARGDRTETELRQYVVQITFTIKDDKHQVASTLAISLIIVIVACDQCTLLFDSIMIQNTIIKYVYSLCHTA